MKCTCQPRPGMRCPLHLAADPMLSLCERLGKIRIGPTDGKSGEWIEKMLSFAEEARKIVADVKAKPNTTPAP